MATSGLMTIIPQDASNLNITWRSSPLITFNNVLENYISVSDANTAYLFTDGCNTTTSSQNCAEVCVNATTAFNSTQTLQNCMQYKNIAKAILDHRIDQKSLDLARKMGIIADGSVEDSVYTNITTCLHDYDNAARSDTKIRYRYKKPPCVGFNETLGSPPCFPNICSIGTLNAQLNSDVGGIGVYVSYYIQSCIALLFYLGFKISFSLTFWVCWPVFTLLRRPNAKRSAQVCQGRMRKHLLGSVVTTQAGVMNHLFGSLVTPAVDFQRGQCFFMLALQMAGLIILFHRGESLGNSSVQQVLNNTHLIGCLSLGGTLPVSFLLACLHIADRRSWYTFALSFATMALSTSTLIYARTHQISADSIGQPPYQLPSCRGSNPIKYCLPDDNGVDDFSWILTHAATTAFCWAILILLFVDTCLHTWCPTKRIVYSSSEGNLAQVSQEQLSWTLSRLSSHTWKSFANPSRKLKLYAAVVYKAAEIGYISGFCVYFADLSQMAFIVPGDWAFGQIIAITVWAPIVLEYVYFELRRVKHPLEDLISKQLKLLELEDDDNDDSSQTQHGPSRISQFLQRPLASLLGLETSTMDRIVVTKPADGYQLLRNNGTPSSQLGRFEDSRLDSQVSYRSRDPSLNMEGE